MPGFGEGQDKSYPPLFPHPHMILIKFYVQYSMQFFSLTSIPVTHMSSQSFFCGSQLLSIAA